MLSLERLNRMDRLSSTMSRCNSISSVESPIFDNNNLNKDKNSNKISGLQKSDNNNDNIDVYNTYLNLTIVDDVLNRLVEIQPPKIGQTLFFSINTSYNMDILYKRTYPTFGGEEIEHYRRAAEWSLPPLLHWIPIDCLIWVLGLLMCEAKVIVVGDEAGMVSCAVMGLLTLLRPLPWCCPLIPILPLRHVEVIESPVPLLAGT